MTTKEINKEMLIHPSESHSHWVLVFATQFDLQFQILHHMPTKVTYFLPKQGQLAIFKFLILVD